MTDSSAASIPGRIVPPAMSDKFGHLCVTTIMSILSGVFTLGIWLPLNFHNSEAGLIMFALAFGFTSGACASLLTPCLVDLCEGKIGDFGVMLGSLFSTIAFA